MAQEIPQPGILAIFNDCHTGREAEFEAWFQGEHLLERLGVPGFLFGRRQCGDFRQAATLISIWSSHPMC